MSQSPTPGSLARAGLVDSEMAAHLLQTPVLGDLLASDDGEFLQDVAGAPDPDQALRLLVRVLQACSVEEAHRISSVLATDSDTRRRMLHVLGMSQALGEFLVRHPNNWQVLSDAEGLCSAPVAAQVHDALIRAVGADPLHSEPVATHPQAADQLRIAYRSHLLGIAARDLSGMAVMDTIASWLSDLADAVLAAALAIARSELGPQASSCRLAIIGMGKCGGRELNYVSDVDVIFVAEPTEGVEETGALKSATALAAAVMRICTSTTAEGTIWEVDANLRPEGRQGALVRTLRSHIGYYQRWAKTWEFQALLKARWCAGDADLGREYVDAIAPFVWSAAGEPGFVDEVQAMRRRVEDHVPVKLGDRELKLGPGGLRDVEFAVQLLQLVHGRSDVLLRSSNTMIALESLATWGYVGRNDAAALAEAYRFLRTLEHRIQLFRLRRTHTMPEAEDELRRLGRSLGYRADPVGELHSQWRQHAREVRRIHEKLFYRPLLQAVARLDPGEARLTREAARERLHALGYVDPAGALRHLEALSSGVSRRAAIQRTLLPVMLGWFAEGPDPDSGLLGFRRVSDELGSTHWYLRLLRDESAAAQRMARIMSSTRYATELLLNAPESVSLLSDEQDLLPRTLEQLTAEAMAAADRHEDMELAVAAVRALRRRELFRTAAARVLASVEGQSHESVLAWSPGPALTDIARATLKGALAAVTAAVSAEWGKPLPMRMAVIGLGRFGGLELGFGSDVDVLFVYEPLWDADDPEATRAAFEVANRLRGTLMAPSIDPPLDLDADLRPEGKSGALVRSLNSYARYYQQWSSPWEAQAMLRASAVAGDVDLGTRFERMIDEFRYPDGGVSDADVTEMRRLKARMEAERLPRGADPTLHTKLGRGGLSDVEWVVQLMQMQYGYRIGDLRTTNTLQALNAAKAHELITAADAAGLQRAWLLATSVRDANMLVRARANDMVPTDVRDLAAVGYVLGYAQGQSGRILDDYRRITRRARTVFERLFYGWTSPE